MTSAGWRVRDSACGAASAPLGSAVPRPKWAERRYAELAERGMDVTRDGVLEDVLARDTRDMGRADAPMRAAADAVLIDTSEMDIETALAAAVAVVAAGLEGAGA